MSKHRPGLAGPEHVTVIDAVRAERHRRHRRHHFPARIRGALALAEIDRPVDQRLDPEALGQHRGQKRPRVGDQPLVVEPYPRRVRQTLHHVGDLLVQARRRRIRQLSACSGSHLISAPDDSPFTTGGSRLSQLADELAERLAARVGELPPVAGERSSPLADDHRSDRVHVTGGRHLSETGRLRQNPVSLSSRQALLPPRT
jgi:hypothetical protein